MARRVSGKRKKGKCVRRARLGQLGGGMAAAMSSAAVDGKKDSKKYVSSSVQNVQWLQAKRIAHRLDRRLDKIDAKLDTTEDEKVPKTFVVHRGAVGRNVQRLVDDLRRCMQPYTAASLKVGDCSGERWNALQVQKRNKLADFVHAARPLGVSHLIVVTKSDASVNLRVCKLPHGPTLTFQGGFSC